MYMQMQMQMHTYVQARKTGSGSSTSRPPARASGCSVQVQWKPACPSTRGVKASKQAAGRVIMEGRKKKKENEDPDGSGRQSRQDR